MSTSVIPFENKHIQSKRFYPKKRGQESTIKITGLFDY